jgi:DNA-binding CsgD family transcriptional regulator
VAETIEIVRGPGTGQVFPLERHTYVIGRSRDCDIVIRDPTVSRRHARLAWTGSSWVVEDEGSAHGVLVGSHRVASAPLPVGSSFTLGSVVLRLLDTEPDDDSTTTGIPTMTPDRAGREGAAVALDRIRIGTVLLGAEGEVLLCNRMAQAVLDENDGLGLAGGRLVPSSRAAARELARLLQQEPGQGGAFQIPREAPRRPLSLLVTPLAADSSSASYVVFIGDPDRSVDTGARVLTRLYDLTPRESRIAGLLVQGRSLDEAAGELGITVATARSHLKRVFQKTQTRGQSDLVRLLLLGPALLEGS